MDARPPLRNLRSRGGLVGDLEATLYDEATVWHESGHAVTAYALGRRVGFVTVVPGERWHGVCRSWAELVPDVRPATAAPLVAWPAAWQRRLAGDVVFALAGGIAEELFTKRDTGAVRLPESVAVQVNDRLAELAEAVPSATATELAEAARSVDAPGKSDAEHVAEIAFETHGGDPHRAGTWLAWLAEETRALLLLHETTVRRVAGLLRGTGTAGEAAIAACLRGEVSGNG